jgi:uncharacterized protein YegL
MGSAREPYYPIPWLFFFIKDFMTVQKTMIALVLDRSGSMSGMEEAVVAGINKFLKEQKELPGSAILTAVRFDTNNTSVLNGTFDNRAIERFREMKNLQDVAPFEASEFVPRGGTPLLDAIGKTIMDLDHDWQKYQPDQAIVVIYTDGQENSSREYTKEKLRKLIETRQESGKWAFLFLGAGIDAFGEASSLGIWQNNIANMDKSQKGFADSYATASASVGYMRATGMTNSVANNLEATYKNEAEKSDAK